MVNFSGSSEEHDSGVVHHPGSSDSDFCVGHEWGIKFREEKNLPLPITALIMEGAAGIPDFSKYFDKKLNTPL